MRSVLSILIAIIFLAGQSGLKLATHYCGGEISQRSMGFGVVELGCGMEDGSLISCENSRNLIKSNCCDDDVQTFSLSDEFKTQTEEVEINQPIALSVVLGFFDLISFNSNNYSEYLNYHPPKLKRDIPVLIQSFLI